MPESSQLGEVRVPMRAFRERNSKDLQRHGLLIRMTEGIRNIHRIWNCGQFNTDRFYHFFFQCQSCDDYKRERALGNFSQQKSTLSNISSLPLKPYECHVWKRCLSGGFRMIYCYLLADHRNLLPPRSVITFECREIFPFSRPREQFHLWYSDGFRISGTIW